MDINIQELSSEVQSAPMAGIPLFCAQITIELPQHVALPELQENLDERADHLDVDISLELNES
jgi:glycine cleavage system regulatory protein